jgi:hypothetical protein
MQMPSETATRLSPSGKATRASPSGRAESAIFNVGLLAALAACVAFWLLVTLTVYWLT